MNSMAVADLLAFSITALTQVTQWQQTILKMHQEGRTDLTDAEVAATRAQALASISLLAKMGGAV